MSDEHSQLRRGVGRGVLVVLGVLGGFVAFDALLLFIFFALSALFIARTGPYFGLVTFVVLPFCAIAGAAVAWTAYLVLDDAVSEPGRRGAHT